MKAFIKTFVFALVILGTTCSAMANGVEGKGGKKAAKKDNKYSYQAAINIHHGNVVAVQFMKPSDQKVTITIKDDSGKTVYYDSIKKHDLIVKKYQLTDFPKGTYEISVKSAKQEVKESIVIH